MRKWQEESDNVKILICESHFSAGGAERVVCNLANHLSKNHEVKVLSLTQTAMAYQMADKIDCECIDKKIYDKTNNISSAMAALEHIDQCYLCEADLYISNPDIITKYQYCSNILGSYSLETDDWSFKLDNGHITDYQKGNTYCFNYYGISYWTKEDSARLREDFAQVYNEEPEGNDYFWEFIPLVLRKERYAVEVRPCEKSDIMEIDNFYELVQLDSSYKDYPGQEQ